MVEFNRIERNGIKMEGVFENDKLFESEATYKDGLCYKGRFDKGGFLVEGTVYFMCGEIHKGRYEGPYMIKGTKYLKDGNLISGRFEKGELVEGKYIYKNGVLEEGKFKDHELIDGKRYLEDGSIIELKYIPRKKIKNRE